MSWTATNLREIETAADQTSYTTAAFTPTANRLLVVQCVTSHAGTGINEPTLSTTMTGHTVGPAHHQVYDPTSDDSQITWWLIATGSAPGSNVTITFDFDGQTQTCCLACVVEVNETSLTVDTGDLDAHIVQEKVSPQSSGPGLEASVTLDATPDAGNMVVGLAAYTSSDTGSAGTNFTRTSFDTSATPPRAQLLEVDLASATTTVNCTWVSTSSIWHMTGIELRSETGTFARAAALGATAGIAAVPQRVHLRSAALGASADIWARGEGALEATSLAVGSPAVANPLVTSSVSPTGEVLFVAVQYYRYSGGDPPTIESISGLGGSWSEVRNQLSANEQRRLSLWVGTGCGGSGTLSITYTGNPPDGNSYGVWEITGEVDTATPVLAGSEKTATQVSAGTSLGVTPNTPASLANLVLVTVVHNEVEGITPLQGTEILDGNAASSTGVEASCVVGWTSGQVGGSWTTACTQAILIAAEVRRTSISADVSATAAISVAALRDVLRAAALEATADIAALPYLVVKTGGDGGYDPGGYGRGYGGTAAGQVFSGAAAFSAVPDITSGRQMETSRAAGIPATAAITASWAYGFPAATVDLAATAAITARPRVLRAPPAVALATPQLSLAVDFVHDPNPVSDTMPTPAWEDISPYVRAGTGFTISRGRTSAVNRVEAGTLAVVLDNRDRRFDPANVDGPYHPYVLPYRRIRACALIDTGTEPFTIGSSAVGGTDVLAGGVTMVPTFTGYIQSWSLDYPQQGMDATVTVRAVDMFALMAQDTLEIFGYAGMVSTSESGGAQVNRLLNQRTYSGRAQGPVWVPAAGAFYPVEYTDAQGDWVNTAYDAATGEATSSYQLVLTNYAGVNFLEALQGVADSDGGLFFIGPDGRPTYLHHSTPSLVPGSLWTFGEGGERFRDVTVAYDESLIFNVVSATAPNLPDVTEEDAASIARYSRRALSASTTLASATDMQSRTRDLLLRYREPVTVIRELDLSNVVDDWSYVLTRDLWDIVMVRVRLLDGTRVDQLSLIEGISISSPNTRDWRVVWRLSEATGAYPNLLSENQAGLEDGVTTGWNAESACTISTTDGTEVLTKGSVPLAPYVFAGRYSLRIVPPGAYQGLLSVVTDTVTGVVAGAAYELSAAVCSITTADLGQMRLEVDWLDAVDAVISTATSGWNTPGSVPATWSFLYREATAPATAVGCRVRVRCNSMLWSVSDEEVYNSFHVDAVSIHRLA